MIPIHQTVLQSESTNGNCLRAAIASILEIDIDAMPAFERMGKAHWKKALKTWLSDRGYHLTDYNSEPVTDDFVIAIGPAERGVLHCIVTKRGKLVHDPHPSGAGLLSINKYMLISVCACERG